MRLWATFPRCASQPFGVVCENLGQRSVELLISLSFFFCVSLIPLNVHFQLPAIIAASEAQRRLLCGATKQPVTWIL